MVKGYLDITWLLNDFCNFNCVYCFSGSKRNKFIGFNNRRKILDGFSRTGHKCHIFMSGGEPFLFPNFTDLCLELTDKHLISVSTNLSHKEVYRFADLIDPKRVRWFHCSLHIQERERLRLVEDFIEKYKYLEKKGFYVFTSYVMYPNLIDRFERDYNYFKSEGIICRPKVFRGWTSRSKIEDLLIIRKMKQVLGLSFPRAYSKKQRDLITKYIERSHSDGSFITRHEDESLGRWIYIDLDKFFINDLPSFKNRYCLAGKSFVVMTPTGDVYRCFEERRYMGNLFHGEIKLFEELEKCKVDKCGCPYIGYICRP